MGRLNITDDGAKNLVCAIVKRAVQDYRTALYGYNTARGRGKKLDYRNVIGECELFFRKNLGFYCDLDGDEIIKKIRNDVRIELKAKGIVMEVPNFDRTGVKTDSHKQSNDGAFAGRV